MPPRRKSALEDLIRQGLVADGELLRYKSKHGELMAIGRAREGGIEVEGKSKLLGYTAFEDVAGSKYHRPAEHTHTTISRNLQGLALLAAGDGGGGAGGRSRKEAPGSEEPALELLEDENDDLCHVCGLGGDLMCCETCPAVFHAACLGLPAPPAGDFFCPTCTCSVCGGGGSEGVMPTGCQWVDCRRFAGTEALQQLSRPHIGPPGDTGSQGSGQGTAPVAGAAADAAAVKAEPQAAPEAAGAAGAAGAQPMQVDAAGGPAAAAEAAAGASTGLGAEEPAADFSQLVAAATAQWQATQAPADAAHAAAARQGAAAAASESAAVPCPVTLRWAHLRCFPPEFVQQLRQGTSQPCISSVEAATASTRLAAACSAGLLQLGSIPEGARAGTGGVDARAPLPLSLLVVRGAAAAAPGDCRGYAPAYSPEQRQQLQVALSAALQVLHSCYEPIPDSRTGADILPWLLRGAVLAGGEADYSGMHTALLYAGSALVAVAVFRSFGEFAELPLLAVRPELQRRNGLGRLLLAAVEQLLLQAGAQWLLMPGFTTDGQPYLPSHPAAHQAAASLTLASQQQQQQPSPPALLQAKWGYSLAAPEQALAASHHPLVRLPGVLFACKQLGPGSVLPPPRLPRRLQWSSAPGDPRQLLREGLLASVAAAPGAAELAAAAAAAARQATQSRARPVGRPPKAPPPAAAPAAALKQQAQQQAQQQATPQQQQQMLLAMMYQQQMMAQQAAAGQFAPGQPVSQQQLMALYCQQQEGQQGSAHGLLEQQQAYVQQLKQQYPEAYSQQLQQQGAQAHMYAPTLQQAATQEQALAAAAQLQQGQQASGQ